MFCFQVHLQEVDRRRLVRVRHPAAVARPRGFLPLRPYPHPRHARHVARLPGPGHVV